MIHFRKSRWNITKLNYGKWKINVKKLRVLVWEPISNTKDTRKKEQIDRENYQINNARKN